MAVVKDLILVGSKWIYSSFDGGNTWTSTPEKELGGHMKLDYFKDRQTGYERIFGTSDGGKKYIYSDDNGLVWKTAQKFPTDVYCGSRAVKNENIVLTRTKDNICYTTDGGMNWGTASGVATRKNYSLVWNGTQFILYGESVDGNRNFTQVSSDGINWTDGPTVSLANGRQGGGKTRYHYDPVSGNTVCFHSGTFLVSDDGINFAEVDLPADQLEGRGITMFSHGDIEVDSSHPCY